MSREFIVQGIRSGQLEYREGAVWGNPYLRGLRRQLEKYIAEKLGGDYLKRLKDQTALRAIKKGMADLKKRLDVLQARKVAIEGTLKKLKRLIRRLPHTALARH